MATVTGFAIYQLGHVPTRACIAVQESPINIMSEKGSVVVVVSAVVAVVAWAWPSPPGPSVLKVFLGYCC